MFFNIQIDLLIYFGIQLIIPRTGTSYGDRSFAVHGTVMWNSLPYELQSTDLSLATFRNRLKNIPV